MITRRRFLLLLPALTASAQSFTALSFKKKKPVPSGLVLVYIGTDTAKGVSKGIYECHFDTKTGKLTMPLLAAATPRPSFLALSPSRAGHRLLYAVNADSSATVTTFDLDPKTGALDQRAQVPAGGAGPCYLSVDPTGRTAFVANYTGGTISSYLIQPNGTLSQPVDIIDYKSPNFGHHGPVAGRQDSSHPHSVLISPDNRFLLVNDLGSDALSVFIIDDKTAHLTPANPLITNTRPGSGPRHMVFHSNGRWIYCINELDSTIDHYLWTTTHASATPQGLLVNTNTPIKTTAAGFSDKNTAAELGISPDGNFLYASNRGEDTLVVYSIAQKDGALTEVQRISCGGKTPRHFTLDPSAQWLLCGNQDSASITVFHRDAGSGHLTGPLQTVPVDSPIFTLFA